MSPLVTWVSPHHAAAEGLHFQGAQPLGRAAAFQFSTSLRPGRWMGMLSGKPEQQTWIAAAGGLWELQITLPEPSALVCVSSQGRDRLT